MSQLLKLELLSMLRDTARRMRGNAASTGDSSNASMLEIAIKLEQEALDLEVTTLSE